MQTVYSIDINAEPHRVFYWLDDPKRVMEWLSCLVENENVTETPEKVGTTFRQVVAEHGRSVEVEGIVTKYERDRCLAVHMQARGFEVDAEYVLNPADQGTRLTQTSEVRFHGLMRVLGWLMVPFIRKSGMKQLERDFATLKRLCEQPPDDRPADQA